MRKFNKDMKKIVFLGSAIASFLTPAIAFADSITVSPGPNTGFKSLGNAISNVITLAFAVAVLIVLVMLILGAYEWIVSGGDKEAVGKARNRIINALLGLVVLAVAFALAKVFGSFVGLNLSNISIPTPDPGATGL